MKKQLLAGLALLLLLPLTLGVWGFGLPPQYQHTFLGGLAPKVERLRTAESPRIVVVGGSAVAFGVDTALMEQTLPGYTVVNFGLYAQLGTRAMVDLSLPLLREGDIVLLMPEQQREALSPVMGYTALWQAADGHWGLLRAARLSDLPRLAGAFPQFAAAKLRYFCSGTPDPEGVYNAASFDERGDILSDLCPANTMPGGWDTAMPISFDPALLTGDFCAMVNGYAASAAEKGAEVWLHFPPMNAAAIDPEAGDPDTYADALRSRLTPPLCGSPQSSTLGAGWFFDTNFHLNSAGKQVFTRQLVRDIKAMLGDSSPTEIPIPVQPPFAESREVFGDDRDADFFVYEEERGGLTIVGLTSEGSARSALTLPTHAGGKAVTAIAPTALGKATALRRLTVQENITALPHGLFAGCSALEQVVLTQPDPAAVWPGNDLMEGANFALLVPPGSLERYLLSYNWAAYAPRLGAAGTE